MTLHLEFIAGTYLLSHHPLWCDWRSFIWFISCWFKLFSRFAAQSYIQLVWSAHTFLPLGQAAGSVRTLSWLSLRHHIWDYGPGPVSFLIQGLTTSLMCVVPRPCAAPQWVWVKAGCSRGIYTCVHVSAHVGAQMVNRTDKSRLVGSAVLGSDIVTAYCLYAFPGKQLITWQALAASLLFILPLTPVPSKILTSHGSKTPMPSTFFLRFLSCQDFWCQEV